MSYIEHSLAHHETLLYRARFPWFYYAGAWLALVAGLAIGIAASLLDYGWLSAAPVLLGVAGFLWIMIPLWTIEIGVTDQRLIYKRGLFVRMTQELQLRAIEEVSLDQGVLGRIFDFGVLELHGTGVDHVRLPPLADPIGLRKALQDGMAMTQPGKLAQSAEATA
jgi:uncharacterized membrane protein YdbT with pleckstrin-like domain